LALYPTELHPGLAMMICPSVSAVQRTEKGSG